MLNHNQLSRALFILGLFIGASFCLPIHLHPYRTFYQDGLAIFGVIFTLGYIACVAGKVSLRIPSAVVVPLGLILVIVLQTANNFMVYSVDMVFPIIYFVCFATALILGATLAMQEGGLEQLAVFLARTFLVVGLISVLFQHVQLFNLNWTPFVSPISFRETPRPFANVAQPNLLALELCFAVASVWFLYVKNHLNPRIASFLVLCLLWGIAISQSRIAWIILPMFVALSWRQPFNSAKISKSLLLLLLSIYIAFVCYLPDVFTSLGITGPTALQRAGQTSIRQILWQQAWTMSVMHPWFGVGWYQFGPNQVMLSTMFKPSEYSEYAHNIVLNFAAEIGWPLTILLGAASLYWFYLCCIRRWKNTQVRFISLMLLATAVHSMVEFPLWDGFFLMPFGIMVGALHVEHIHWKNIVVARAWIITLVLSSAMAMGAMIWDYTRVVNGFVELVQLQKGSITEAKNMEKPEWTLFPQFFDYFHVVKIRIHPQMPKEDIQFLERASLRFGFMPILSRLALAYAYNQRPMEALKVLYVIERIAPVEYKYVYADWLSFAQKDPATFGEITKRMPQ